MSNLIDMVAMEVRLNYVSASWVSWYYDVSIANVYAAIASGRLKAVTIPARERNTILFDRRTLPNEWPGRRRRKARRRKAA